MANIKAPVVVNVPYNSPSGDVSQSINALDKDVMGKDLRDTDRKHLIDYPTVYIVHRKKSENDSIAYVGETTSIARRTKEHAKDEEKIVSPSSSSLWAELNKADGGTDMYVIGHPHFNKSLTLDLEDRFMGYLLANDGVSLVNGRTNPQGEYFTSDELDEVASKAWRKLHRKDRNLFQDEQIIMNSAIFKASPFHKLGKGQLEAEDQIIEVINGILVDERLVDTKTLILVEGAAGTGKTVLLSHLFLRINDMWVGGAEPGATRNLDTALIVNHNEQVTTYEAIVKRLGLQRKGEKIVYKSTGFINAHSPKSGSRAERQNNPDSMVDVALIDEAHLLLLQHDQSYVSDSKNQLVDIMRRARVTIAVFDPNQILRKSQELGTEERAAYFPVDRFLSGLITEKRGASLNGFDFDVMNIRLDQQFRIDASDAIIDWIDNLIDCRPIGPIPQDDRPDCATPYQIRVFESPFELRDAISKKAEDTGCGLSRMLATYDWKYADKKTPDYLDTWDVTIVCEGEEFRACGNTGNAEELRSYEERNALFHMPWNYQLDDPVDGPGESDKAWAEKDFTVDEVGSIFTIQGFDLNYAGVIIGPSVKLDGDHIKFDKKASFNRFAKASHDNWKSLLRNELNVLLKRGVHGLYLFAADPALQQYLLEMAF